MASSFISSNSLMCRSCARHYPIEEENFPPDLFLLLLHYDVPQIHWLCKSCNDLDSTPKYLQEVLSKISNLQQDVDDIKAMNPRMSSVYDEDDVRFNGSSSSLRVVDSTSFPRRSSGFHSFSSRCSTTPELNKSFVKSPSLYQSDSSRSRSASPVEGFRSKDRSPERSREALRVINQILNDEIKINKNQAATSVAAVDAFIKILNPYLKKEDPVFKYLYSRDYKTGSSYNDLKISSADEYDINIMLIPPGEFELKVEFFEKTKAFSKIKWCKVKEVPESKDCVLKFFRHISNDRGYLYPLKLKHWFQGLIDKFCLSNPKIKGIKKFISSESGPARTIILETEQGYSISLDLVPVFTFTCDSLSAQDIPRLQEYQLEKSKAFCSFVPKSCDGEEDLSMEDCKLSWRTYIPEIDKKVWYNKQCAKNVIKLLKLLRDKQDWKCVASYHLATVILWEIHSEPLEEHWKGPVLFERFIQALEKLQEYLSKKYLPYFVYPEYNLFHSLKSAQSENLSNRIKHIVKSLKSDHNTLTTFFKLSA